MTVLLVVALVAAIGLLTLQFPRGAIVGVLLWLLLEGELRRRLPLLDTPLLLAKDVWIFLLYAALFVHTLNRRRRLVPRHMKPSILIWLAPLLLISIVQVFGSHSTDLLTGILGLKIYYFYVPLALVIAWWTTAGRHVERLLRVFAVMAIVVGLGALYYLAIDPQTFAAVNSDVWTSRVRSFGAETVLLPSSVFMGEGRLGGYSMYFTLLFAAVLLTGRRHGKRSDYWLYTAAFVLALLGLVVSGRRTPILTTAALLPLLVVVLRQPGRPSSLVRGHKTLTRVAVGVTIGAVVLVTVLPEHSQQLLRFGEFTFESQPGASSSFTNDAWHRPIAQFRATVDAGGWLGRGIGVSSQGRSFIDSTAEENNRVPSEHGPHKVLWELGLVGLVAFAGFYLSMWRATYRSAARIRGTRWHGVATGLSFGMGAFLLHFWKSYQFHDDAFQQIMVWVFVGMLFAVTKIAGDSNDDPNSGVVAHRSHVPVAVSSTVGPLSADRAPGRMRF